MAVAIAKSTFPAPSGKATRLALNSSKFHAASRSLRSYPIPREDTPYSQAKKFEYVDKDLDRAEEFYHRSISTGVRAESALKDLASLMHQRGRTEEACDLLREHKALVKEDPASYQNLLSNLQEKVANRNPRYLLLKDLPKEIDEKGIRMMFTHPQRIMEVEILPCGNDLVTARLKCMSISAAKKTIGSFTKRKEMQLEIEDSGDKGTDVSDSETESCDPQRSPKKAADCLPRELDEDFDFSDERLLGRELMQELDPVRDR